jgi:hypothetical protein
VVRNVSALPIAVQASFPAAYNHLEWFGDARPSPGNSHYLNYVFATKCLQLVISLVKFPNFNPRQMVQILEKKNLIQGQKNISPARFICNSNQHANIAN